MLFVAQLWKQINGKLENKNGHWMYMEETWILPNETKTNDLLEEANLQVIKNTLGRVLKANSDSKGILLKQFFTVVC